jgi:hypothetical protein
MCKASAINHNSPRHRLHTQLVGCSCLSVVDRVHVPLFGMFNSHDGSICQFWAVLPPRVVCGPFMFVGFLRAGACLSSLVGCIRYCILSLLVNRDLVKHVLIFPSRRKNDVWCLDWWSLFSEVDKHPPRVHYTLRQGQSHPVTDRSPSPHSLLVPSVLYRRPGETTHGEESSGRSNWGIFSFQIWSSLAIPPSMPGPGYIGYRAVTGNSLGLKQQKDTQKRMVCKWFFRILSYCVFILHGMGIHVSHICTTYLYWVIICQHQLAWTLRQFSMYKEGAAAVDMWQ